MPWLLSGKAPPTRTIHWRSVFRIAILTEAVIDRRSFTELDNCWMYASSRTLLVRRISAIASGLMSFALIGSGLYSGNSIGSSAINIGIAIFAVVQTMGPIRKTTVALRLVGIEIMLLSILQLFSTFFQRRVERICNFLSNGA